MIIFLKIEIESDFALSCFDRKLGLFHLCNVRTRQEAAARITQLIEHNGRFSTRTDVGSSLKMYALKINYKNNNIHK